MRLRLALFASLGIIQGAGVSIIGFLLLMMSENESKLHTFPILRILWIVSVTFLSGTKSPITINDSTLTQYYTNKYQFGLRHEYMFDGTVQFLTT